METLFIKCQLFFCLREFSSFILAGVYIPPQANVSAGRTELGKEGKEMKARISVTIHPEILCRPTSPVYNDIFNFQKWTPLHYLLLSLELFCHPLQLQQTAQTQLSNHASVFVFLIVCYSFLFSGAYLTKLIFKFNIFSFFCTFFMVCQGAYIKPYSLKACILGNYTDCDSDSDKVWLYFDKSSSS